MKRRDLDFVNGHPSMRHTILTALFSLGALGAFGCDASNPEAKDQNKAGGDAATPASTLAAAEPSDPDDLSVFDPRVAKATSLARAIETRPLEADEALSDAGSTREELEQLMYEIAMDPDLSEQYRIARSS